MEPFRLDDSWRFTRDAAADHCATKQRMERVWYDGNPKQPHLARFWRIPAARYAEFRIYGWERPAAAHQPSDRAAAGSEL